MQKILKSIATLGPIGYFPAPGTMGTFAALPLVYALSFISISWQVVIIIMLSVISYGIIHEALKKFDSVDPSQIILDEVVGTLVTFIGLHSCSKTFFLGFVLFRVLDIFKPFGIKYLEKLPGAFGVLVDDFAAGFIANLILRCLLL